MDQKPKFAHPDVEYERFNCHPRARLQKIEAWLGQHASPVLVLRGRSGSGRSYALRSIAHACDKKGDPIRVVRVNLSDWNGSEHGVVTEYIESRMRERGPAGDDASDDVFETVREVAKIGTGVSLWAIPIAIALELGKHARRVLDWMTAEGDGPFRAEARDRVRQVLRRLAAERPTVLHVDPLHALPDLELHELGRWSEEIDGLHLAISAPPDLDFGDRFRELRETPDSIDFEPLSREDVEQIVDLRFPPGGYPDRFYDLLHETTDGHAEFLLRKLFELVQSGALVAGESDDWKLEADSLDGDALVRSLGGDFRRRVDSLVSTAEWPRQLRQLLDRAALCGQHFPLSVLAASSGLREEVAESVIDFIDDYLSSEADASEAVPLLRESGFRHPSFPGLSVYSFVGSFERAAILDGLPASKREAESAKLLDFLQSHVRNPRKGGGILLAELLSFKDPSADHPILRDLRWWVDRDLAPALRARVQGDVEAGGISAEEVWGIAVRLQRAWPAYRILALLDAIEGRLPVTVHADYFALCGFLNFFEGRYRRAREMFEGAVSRFGSSRQELILTIRGFIATCAENCGESNEALLLYERLLSDQEPVLGLDHPDTLRTRFCIAGCLGRRGDFREALRRLCDLQPTQEERLGEFHTDTLRTRHNVASWTGECGDPREALRLFEKLLPDQEQALGESHPDTLSTRCNIASWTGECGDAREALRLAEKLLPDRVRVLGPDHPKTLLNRRNIARWTGEIGDSERALRMYQDVLPDQERVSGSDHPDTLSTRERIASATGTCGKPQEARHLLEELLSARLRVSRADHPATLLTRNNLASWAGECGDSKEALGLLRELLPDHERVMGSFHPDTLRVRHNISGWTGECGEPDEALRLFTELLPDKERVFGADHPETLLTRFQIARLTDKCGDSEESLRLLQQLAPDQERVLGPDHPETRRTRAAIESSSNK